MPRTVTLNVIPSPGFAGFLIEERATIHLAEGGEYTDSYVFPEWYGTREEAEKARRDHIEGFYNDWIDVDQNRRIGERDRDQRARSVDSGNSDHYF